MSRKYRQPGYMESDRDEPTRQRRQPSGRPLSPEERARRKGLRHAVDREANEVIRCHVCGRNVQAFGTITTESTCPHCNAPMHCCRTCIHFDPSTRWECRAEITERVADKGAVNHCPQFRPRLVLDATGRRSGNQRSDDPRSAFENLFKR